MLGDRRITAGQVDGPLELIYGAAVIALLVIDPAEAIDVKPVFGLDLQRAFDQAFGFVELVPDSA